MKRLSAVLVCIIVFMLGLLSGVIFAKSRMNERLARINDAVSTYVVHQQKLVAVYEPAIEGMVLELKELKEAEDTASNAKNIK